MSYISKGNSYGLFEKQTITPDGTTDTFNLSFRPGQSGAILVVYAGTIQEPGRSYNLVNGGRQIKFSFVPDAGDQLYVLYLGRELAIPAVVGNYPVHITKVGDGINSAFSLLVNFTPVEPAIMVFKNGTLQHHPADWTLDTTDGVKIAFSSVPASGDKLDIYIHGVERTDLLTVDDASITAQKLNLAYTLYTPNISTFNGMSLSSPEISVSRYLTFGKYCKVRLLFSATFGDTASNTVRFTLPLENDGSGLVAGTATLSTSTTLEHGVLRWGGLNEVDIKRINGVDFTVGEEWTFEIVLEYDLV
jgi:hypothetical protein